MGSVSYEASRVRRIIEALDLPDDQYLLSGSGVLVLHGIQRSRPMGDLDVFVATRLWMQLYDSGAWEVWTTDPADPARRNDPPYLVGTMLDLEVNIFHSWRKRSVGNIDVAHWMVNAERVQGVPCTPLSFMLDWKVEVGREKDFEDILLIRRYLGLPDPVA